MKKEVFLAIAIGFALGLIITFGIWTANRSLKQANQNKTTTTITVTSPSPAPESQTTTSTGLVISSPEDESLVTKNSAVVTGKASPNSIVVILAENDEQIMAADANGNFSTDVTLTTGYNNITVTAYDSTGKAESRMLTVTYSTAKI